MNKKDELYCLYKRPGKGVSELYIPNELEWLQGAVEGYVEAVPLRPDLVMIVNEEGKLKGMEHNFFINFRGDLEEIVGPALFLGMDGDEFTDCPIEKQTLVAVIEDGFMEAVLNEWEG